MKKGEQQYIISSLLRVLKIVLRSDVATHKQENGGGGGGVGSRILFTLSSKS